MSLTVSGIVAAIGGSLSSIAEGAISIIKIVASVGFALAFATAVITIVSLLYSFVTTSIIGEVFSLVSMCLPFNASVIFSGIWSMLSAILAFLVSRRIYMLTMNLIAVG